MANWDKIVIEKLNFCDIVRDPLYMGEEYFGEVVVDLGALSPDEVEIEMVVTESAQDGSTKILAVKPLTMQKHTGRFTHYSIEMIPAKPGNFNYGFRLFPKNKNLSHRCDFALVKWL